MLRSAFNRALAVVVWAVCAAFAAGAVAGGVDALLRSTPVIALIGYATWAALWRPTLVVTDAAVTLHNPFHTIRVPWAALIHVDTKYAMTLVTPNRRYAAWVAPAPGALTTRRLGRAARKAQRGGVQGSAQPDPGATPGELRGSESATAAELVRARWQAGLADGTVPAGSAVTTPVASIWHVTELSIVGALLALSVVAVSV